MKAYRQVLLAFLPVLLVAASGAVCFAQTGFSREPYIFEDFTGSGLFFEGSRGSIRYSYTGRGTYKISALKSGGVGRSLVSDDVGDFELSAKVRILDYDEEQLAGAAGVIFRVEESGGALDYYTFNIESDGKFLAGKFIGGKFTRFYKPQESDAIKSGWNTLGVRFIGSEIILFINGEEVSRVTADELTGGGYGLYATAGVSAEYDDFKLDLLYTRESITSQPGIVDLPDFDFIPLDSDDFSGDGPLFYEGEDEFGSFTYTERETYEVDLSDSPWPVPSTVPGNLANGSVSVSGFFLKAPDPDENHLGVIVRYRERDDGWGDYYVFQIYPAGFYKFNRVMGDEIIELVSATATDAIKMGDVNKLSVIAEGGSFYLLINGRALAVVKDLEIASGGYGVYLTGGAAADFIDFEVYALKGIHYDTTGMVEPKRENYIDLTLKLNDYLESSFDEDTGENPFATGEKDGIKFSASKGIYVIDALDASEDAFSFISGRFNKYQASVRARKLEGRDKLGYGIVLQVSPSQASYIAFVITNDGFYSIQRSDSHEVEMITEWTETDLLRADEWNEIVVRCVGGKYTFYINGEIVEAREIEGFRAGGAALVAAAGLKVAFDDFAIEKPRPAEFGLLLP